MAKTEEVALREVECQVCMEHMSSPIMMCKTGHNICSSCQNDFPSCPSCKEKFVTNNKPLLKISEKIISLRRCSPQIEHCRSPLDLLDEYHTKNAIAEEISQIVLSEIQCQLCKKYLISPIYFCVNGHNVCVTYRTCS